MTAFGPFAVAAVVLVVGGIFKLRDPGPTREMFASLGLPASTGLAHASGVAEVVIGVAAILVGGPVLAAAVALLFLLFAAMTARLVRLGDAAASCGCFGRLSARPSAIHVAVDLGAAAVAAVAAVAGTSGLLGGWSELEWAGLQLAFIALAAWLVIAVLTVLPATMAATRRGPAAAAVHTFEIGEHAW